MYGMYSPMIPTRRMETLITCRGNGMIHSKPRIGKFCACRYGLDKRALQDHSPMRPAREELDSSDTELTPSRPTMLPRR